MRKSDPQGRRAPPSQPEVDLIFFSTTQFDAFSLGPTWKRKFGVPYVLDYHDPWVNNYYRETGTIIGFGEGPEDAGVEDKTFVGKRVNGQIIGNLAAKAAKFMVNGMVQPKGQNVLKQFSLDALSQQIHEGSPNFTATPHDMADESNSHVRGVSGRTSLVAA